MPAPPATSRVSPVGGLVSSPGVCLILARRKRRREQRDGHGRACGGGRWRRSEGDRHLPAGVGSSRDRRDAGRGRWRQGRAPGGAFANRRRPCAAWLLRDDGRVPADHRGSAIDRRSARSAVTPERGRPGGDPRAQRGDPPDPRRDRHPRRSGGGDHPRARRSRRASRLRRPIERDGRGPADGLLRRPAGHVPERRGAGRDPPARQPVLGLAVHRAGRDLPPAERRRPPEGPDGRRRAADGLPARGRHPLHGRPRHVQPEGRRSGGQLRPRRGAGLRPGEPGPLHGARR